MPLLLIALLKSRRRKARFSDGHPAERVGGGWNEVVSLATDMGAAVDTRATRRESAVVLGEAFPGTAGTTTLLAHRADASIFGAGQPSEAEVQEYWTIVDGSLKEMTATVGFWGRQAARFSPRSLLSDGRTALKLRGLRPVRPAKTDPAGRVDGGPAPSGSPPPSGPAASGTDDEQTVLRRDLRENRNEP